MKRIVRFIQTLRNYSVILFATLGLILAIGAVLYYLEVTFQREKNSLIVSNPNRYFADLRQTYTTQLTELSIQVLTQGNSQNYLEFKKLVEQIVANPESIIYGIELFTNNNTVKFSYEDKAKFRRMNNRNNCLISRSFSHLTQISISVGDKEYGRLVAYYTSPINSPEIEQLTRRYVHYALLIPICLIGLYGLIMRWFLLPVKRVVDHLSIPDLETIEVIRKPKTLIEHVYNRMARNTKLLTVNLKIAELVASQPNLTIEETIAQICNIVEQQMKYDRVSLLLLDKQTHQLEVYHVKEKIPLDTPLYKRLVELGQTNRAMILHRSEESANVLLDYFQTQSLVLCPVSTKEDSIELLAVSSSQKYSAFTEQDKEIVTFIAQQMSLALQKKEYQRRLIDQEKNQVSINLARNLGHDLTNVIAATRWDLNTLQSLIEQFDPNALPPNQKTLFIDAIQGLKNNTEFLQEIVDIYRAFAYLKKPKYELVDLNQLLLGMVDLFRLSTAGKIEFLLELDNELPQIELEPRLFKLAIFNLITNALEAIKLASISQPLNGTVTLQTTINKENGRITILIKDNGWGIRDERGNLIPEEQTKRLFNYGYSTKDKDAAGGLGLAWVQTIISEFHGGKISARNNPTGGATFCIELPSHEP
ncbi:MAG: HAMP domain-containing histidine kinase [bacterium]|nr:HAMP domain-containing histidine kinase [bacterium]